jgi:hypothetical protein
MAFLASLDIVTPSLHRDRSLAANDIRAINDGKAEIRVASMPNLRLPRV